MSKNIDLFAVSSFLTNPLSLCASSGQYLSPKDARTMLNNWDEHLNLRGDNPIMTATEILSRQESDRYYPGPISFVPSGHRVPIPQQSVMKFDPAIGDDKPYPSHAAQYRKWHGGMAWLFNPWTGERRLAADIGRDVFGSSIKEPANGSF